MTTDHDKREREREYQARYQRENRERLRECKRLYYQKNRKRILAKLRQQRQTDPEGVRESDRRYWAANRDRISAKRRIQYATDAAFADQVKERARRHREQRSARNRERMKTDPAYAERKRQLLRNWRKRPKPLPLHLETDGKPVRVYSSWAAARMIECSPSTLANWLRDGWIPEPARLRNRRVYTKRQIKLMAAFHSLKIHDREGRDRVSKLIHENWKK